ncbi:MAG: hypothetical protein EHM41_05085 [Chloroflexi bacterium]|nr:MAG: hypothetical protein EHM41_05085 [Chloroflexota bacterium]
MQLQDIITLAEYHAWANQRLMRRAAHLTNEQLHTKSWLSQETIFRTLAHLLDVQWSWRMACESGWLPMEYITAEDFDKIQQLRKSWQTDDLALINYATSLTDQQLNQTITYSWPQARPRVRPLWHILLHIINHGTHHRAEVGQYLATINRSPGDMDLLNYLASKNVEREGDS